MGGGRVQWTGYQDPYLSIPIGTESGLSGKVMGWKTAFHEPESGAWRNANVNIGRSQAPVHAVTGGVKNPLVQFVYGTLGTMTPEQQVGFMGKIFGEPRYSSLVSETSRVASTGGKEALSLTRLAHLYSEATGGDYSPWRFAEQLYHGAIGLARRSPDETLRDFGYGIVDEPQYVPFATIDKKEIELQKARLRESVDQARSDNPNIITESVASDILDESGNTGFYKFTPAGDDRFLWSIKYTGFYGTMASGVTPEHPYASYPGMTPDEMASVNAISPYLADRLYRQQDELASPGVKAWRQLSQFYTFQESSYQAISGQPLHSGFEGRHYTPVNEEQASQILTALRGIPQEERGFAAYQQAV